MKNPVFRPIRLVYDATLDQKQEFNSKWALTKRYTRVIFARPQPRPGVFVALMREPPSGFSF